MSRNVLKFGVGGLALVAVAVGVLLLLGYLRHRASPEYQTERALKELERRYAEDPYGGNTPEETLQLFIDALKKGDIELASKYFLLEQRTGIIEDLTEAKESNSLIQVANRLEGLKLNTKGNDSASFSVTDKDNVIQYQALLQRSPNGKWKIIDL